MRMIVLVRMLGFVAIARMIDAASVVFIHEIQPFRSIKLFNI